MEGMKKKIIENAAMQAEKKISENEHFVPEQPKEASKRPLIITTLLLTAAAILLMGYRIYELNRIPEMSQEEMMINAHAVLYVTALSVESFRNSQNRLPLSDEIEIDNEYVFYNHNGSYYSISVKSGDTMLIYNSKTDPFPGLPGELRGGK